MYVWFIIIYEILCTEAEKEFYLIKQSPPKWYLGRTIDPWCSLRHTKRYRGGSSFTGKIQKKKKIKYKIKLIQREYIQMEGLQSDEMAINLAIKQQSQESFEWIEIRRKQKERRRFRWRLH